MKNKEFEPGTVANVENPDGSQTRAEVVSYPDTNGYMTLRWLEARWCGNSLLACRGIQSRVHASKVTVVS